jgi:uncharacterized membrane protein
MECVKEVKQLVATRLHWKAAIAGHEKEWNAKITEQARNVVARQEHGEARSEVFAQILFMT